MATAAVSMPPMLPALERRPLPTPEECDLGFVRQTMEFAEDRRDERRSIFSLGGPAQRSSRVPEPDNFSFGLSLPSKSAKRSSRANTGRPRPTQRQHIDEETTVPAEVYQSMLRLGAEVRGRMQHNIAFAAPSGKPYLRHHNAAAIEAAAAETEATAPVAAAPAEPISEAEPPPIADVEPTEPIAEPEPAASVAFPPLPARPPSACASEVADEERAATGAVRHSHLQAVPVQVQ
eukprot:gnl/TRDRNA2_/TRDRNA2_194909_c0_seq1.p1 gnl/TRDRNA2_/TRDRNA2_194909_c0~~gnl/TRDRNA2_/TRDRNA2_194909_c0_seq1.p1  ORF type:complete len:234 (+),score=39.08 gnl/TRDRNA2_/TRDRNA2_194909_c0_seq1:206-907(+)